MLRLRGGTAGVELLDEMVGSPEGEDVAEPEGVPIAVPFEEIVGSPNEGDPLDEVLLADIVGSPDGLEAGIPAEELLFADIVGTPDGVEVAWNPMDELFDEIVWNREEAVELGSKVGIKVLFMEIELLPEGLTVGLTPVVVFDVTFGSPLIRTALIVR